MARQSTKTWVKGPSTFLSTAILVAATQVACGPIDHKAAVAASVCDLNERPDRYMDVVVRVKAEYHTDSSHYAFLQDKECSGDGRIDVGEAFSSRSFRSLSRKWETECAARGAGLCVVERMVEVRGTLRMVDGVQALDVFDFAEIE